LKVRGGKVVIEVSGGEGSDVEGVTKKAAAATDIRPV